MSQDAPGFQHRIGLLERLFGSAKHSEVVLENGVLRLGSRDGSAETLRPSDVVSPIHLRRGLFWHSVGFRHRDGRRIRVAGIRRAEAAAVGRILETWGAPALHTFFAELESKLQATETLVVGVLDGSRYIRHSAIVSVAE